MNKEAGHSFSVRMITGLKIVGEVSIFLWSVSPYTEVFSISVGRSLNQCKVSATSFPYDVQLNHI